VEGRSETWIRGRLSFLLGTFFTHGSRLNVQKAGVSSNDNHANAHCNWMLDRADQMPDAAERLNAIREIKTFTNINGYPAKKFFDNVARPSPLKTNRCEHARRHRRLPVLNGIASVSEVPDRKNPSTGFALRTFSQGRSSS
jgi:hypothetical protein